jgi:cyclophilin family peptidyl-prolyl cis-trans isomerase
MWDRIHGRRVKGTGSDRVAGARPIRPVACQPRVDALEDRQLMTASLQPIAELSVPALQGSTVPLLANTGATDPQTYTVTSSNPDVAASVAEGPFWSLGVAFNDSATPTDNFTGTLTFQLFQNLTPNTVKMIEQFTNDGYYVNTGKYFPRIVSDFDSPLTDVIQGGATSITGSGSSGQPDTPFANENVQELALTGVDQLAMANAGGTDTNNTQFFINTGPADSLGYNYTVFGQLVSGQNILQEITAIPVTTNPTTQEDSEPTSPLTITSASLSSTNPDGVVILNTTAARPGETSTITVTATDPADGTTATQSFQVAVGDYAGPTTTSTIGNINFAPYASPIAASTYENMSTTVKLSGENTYPVTSDKVPLVYSLLTDPAHGTVSDFNTTNGTFTYTPAPGYAGPDTIKYSVTAEGPVSTATDATSLPATVTLNVAPTPPVVHVQNVALSTNKRKMVTAIDVTFSGPVNAADAAKTKIYHLAYPNKQGPSTARNAAVVNLKSAAYDPTTDIVTLELRTPQKLKAQALQLTIDGTSPSGLEDIVGRYLDGADNGQPGSNAVVSITRNGVNVE